MWRYLWEQRPWLFWEWHSNNWHRRPGHMLLRYRPELVADRAARALWREIDRRLLALPGTHTTETGPHTARGSTRQSIGFQAVTRLGAIACMIKQHDRFPLAQSRDHAVACLRTAVEAFEDTAQDSDS